MSISQSFPELKDFLGKYEEYLQILISIDGAEKISALIHTAHYHLDSQIPLCDETELHEFYDSVSGETSYYYHTSLLKLLAQSKSFEIQLNKNPSTFIENSDFATPPIEFKGQIIK